jgi:hypothetical protein
MKMRRLSICLKTPNDRSRSPESAVMIAAKRTGNTQKFEHQFLS